MSIRAATPIGTLWLGLALGVLASPARAQAPDSSGVSAFWKTRAERTGYRQTADYDETMRFCRALEGASNWVRVVSYGESGQGRDLPLVIVSKDRAFTPEQAKKLGRPIVLIQNGIHSGEIEGKDASLALLRDMVISRKKAALLDHAIVLVLPIFSVDAHERKSSTNRINQNGPDEMGWRATPIGLNLNRDYLKVEAPEMRAMISQVYTRWLPHLLIDNHTTDGADYRHDVTYGFNHGPEVPASIVRWHEQVFEESVVPRLTAQGHLPAPYLTFRLGADPRSGIEFDDSRPRISHGYAPLQCRAGILVETHMLKPYEARVRATYDLLVAVLEEVNAHPEALLSAVAEAENEVVARGRLTDASKRAVTLTTKLTGDSVSFDFKGLATRYERSDISGGPVPRYSTTPWDTTISLFRQLAPEITVRQPVGYLVPQEWTAAIDRLTIHGVKFRRFARAWSDSVEQTRVLTYKTLAPYEGHRPDSAMTVETVHRWRTYRSGDVWVPLDQPSALVAVHLFEAQAPDGLFQWNFFDTIFLKVEGADDYVMEPIARKMMSENPALAAEFKAKLAAEPEFAKDPRARLDWFYRRSKWADPEQNLIPVARALHRPPDNVLAP